MKCCAFGTIRMDIHVNNVLSEIEVLHEVKVDKLKVDVGGSVCNTCTILTHFNCENTFYSLNINGPMAKYLETIMEQRKINIKFNNKDINDSAVSLISYIIKVILLYVQIKNL